MKRAVAAFTLLLAACGGSNPLEPRSSQPLPPATIPALREWTAGAGAFRLSPGSRIVVASDDERLRADAATFADDLQAVTGQMIPVVENTIGSEGDIELDLAAADGVLGDEGYRLDVGPTLTISANAPAGAFYGTRSVLQWLRAGAPLAGGVARDWPRYAERGLMVDVGRKFFTLDWLHRHVREMAWLKLNYLHVHFSENIGFRIESTTHPEIVSAEHYTKAQVTELIALADRYHIAVVGEIGMPGHMGAALAPHPEYQLTDAQGNKAPNQLDVTIDAARAFAFELIEEYLALFPGTHWHAGGDEYMPPQDYPKYPQLETYARDRYGATANGKDAVIGFMNDVNELVRGHGRTNRVWNDGLGGGSAVALNPNVVVEWWTDFSPLGDAVIATPQELLDLGHSILNASYWPTYYTVGAAAGFPEGLPPRPDNCSAYEEWAVNQFVGPLNPPAQACHTEHASPPKLVADDEPANLGAKFHEWNDTPDAETEEEIALGIAPRLRWMAQKTWHSPQLPTWAQFEALAAGIGPAP